MELAIDVYRETEKFIVRERYGLVDQMRRASVSVPSNITEGAARQTRKEFINFLHIGQGSLSELDTQIELARRLNFIDEKLRGSLDQKMDRIDKTISGLIRHLQLKVRTQ